MTDALTKADTVALWHAVEAFGYAVRVMPEMVPPLSQECIEQDRKRLAAAKKALRKVNAIRKEQQHD